MDARDDITKAHFNGKVDVSYDPSVSEDTRAAMQPAQIARLAGAMDDSRIQVAESAKAIFLTVRHRMLTEMIREIRTGEDGLVLIVNESFLLKTEYQNQGLGVRSFAIEATEASAQDFSKIVTEAVGSRDSAHFNGYYTWPRLGYDAELEPGERARLPEPLQYATTVLDLMDSEEGRAWWYENGAGRLMEFDLKPDSRSWAILNRYMQENGIRS
ncbi:hypothetical protein [Cupriavidus basilensis]|uniref:hypothetical protein n=1 Tax=Cupriavidus basilensis TaxID=68895 RepID=UPI0012E03959|nr:hypothetical protein [Cupriavidus basilensis]